MKKPRIIIWDIETVYNVVATFRLMNQDPIPGKNILNERYVVSAAWKELGEKKVHAVSVLDYPELFKKDVREDRGVLEKLHDVMKGADVLVAHNGDSYDIKFTETRMLIKGFEPLPPIPTIDTLTVAKRRFLFNSNRLDYLGQVLGLGRKVHTDEDLWLRVMSGEVKAIKQMVTYNKGDVELLEKVFLKLQPYVPNHISRYLFGQVMGCPRCGSLHTKKDGFHYAQTQKYQQYQCLDCGGYFRDRSAIKPSPIVRVL